MMFTMANQFKTKQKLMDTDQNTIGTRIAHLRKERGLTQVQLAERIGIGQTLITDYERGKLRLHAEMVIRFAMALEVSTDDLLGVQIPAKDAYNPSLRLIRRWQKIEKLPKFQQKILLKTIDNFLEGAEKKRIEKRGSQ